MAIIEYHFYFMESKTFQRFKIQNSKGLFAEISDFGAKILSLLVPDREGKFQDILIGFEDESQYFDHDPYFNGVCGRFAGRIGWAKFMLNGKEYRLTQNAGAHQLHGGFQGFHNRFWQLESLSESSITLYYFSKDGEEGFPGNCKVWVTYEIDNQNRFFTHFKAISDQDTFLNLCQHAYFNLNGKGTIKEHQLQIQAERYTEFDDQLINTGHFLSVANTPLDFRHFKTLEAIDRDPFFDPTLGIDHCFEISKSVENHILIHASTLVSEQSGISLELFTDQPALVVYTGNYIEEQPGKGGIQNSKHTAICLEAQGFPNSPNCPSFPSTKLIKGKMYTSNTYWQFNQ